MAKELKINDTYSIERDPNCWILRKRYIGGKDNKLQTKQTYHSRLQHVIDLIIDLECGECSTFQEIKELLQDPASKILGKTGRSLHEFVEENV